jgi:hypothetical protein
VLVTHRIAGPVMVMTNYLRVLAEGRIPAIRNIRKGDELHTLFDMFHSAIDYVWAREVAHGYKLQELTLKLQAHASTPELREVLQGLETLHQDIHQATSRFDAVRGAMMQAETAEPPAAADPVAPSGDTGETTSPETPRARA